MQLAVNYGQRILDSEGGEAAYLLGKDEDCVKSFKYAMDFMKCNKQAKVLDQLKHINHLSNQASTLPELTQLSGFKKYVTEVGQVYNDYIGNAGLPSIVSEITDLRNQIDSYLTQACVEFQTQGNSILGDCRDEVKAMAEYPQLTDSQKIQIDTQLDNLNIDCRSDTIEGLREMVNTFVSYKMNNVDAIKNRVRNQAKSNAPAVVVTPPADPEPHIPYGGGEESSNSEGCSAVQDPGIKTSQVKFKKRITTKADLQAIIDELTKLLTTVDDNNPVVLNINE